MSETLAVTFQFRHLQQVRWQAFPDRRCYVMQRGYVERGLTQTDCSYVIAPAGIPGHAGIAVSEAELSPWEDQQGEPAPTPPHRPGLAAGAGR